MQGSWIAVQFYHFIRGWFSRRKHSYSGQYWLQVDWFLLQVFKQSHRRNFLLPYQCDHLLELKSSKRSTTHFIFIFFSLTSCNPDGPALFGLAFSAKNNCLQSMLLPAGGPTTYLTCPICNPGQIILMKIQVKMVNWKICMCCCLNTKALR